MEADKRPSPPAPKGARAFGTGTYVGPIKDLAGETALLLTDPDDKTRLYAQFDEFDLEHPMKPGQMLSHGWTNWNRRHWAIDEYATMDLPED